MPTSDAISAPSTVPTVVPAVVRNGRWVVLALAEALSMPGEFHLAQQVGFHPLIATLFPALVAAYGFCSYASHSRADVRVALGIMIACQALTHLLAVGIIPRHWAIVVIVSCVAPVVCWRVHHLATHLTPAASPVAAADEATEDVPVSEQPALEPAHTPPTVPTLAPVLDLPFDIPARPERGRPKAETADLARRVLDALPHVSHRQVAAVLEISPSRLRECLQAA